MLWVNVGKSSRCHDGCCHPAGRKKQKNKREPPQKQTQVVATAASKAGTYAVPPESIGKIVQIRSTVTTSWKVAEKKKIMRSPRVIRQDVGEAQGKCEGSLRSNVGKKS